MMLIPLVTSPPGATCTLVISIKEMLRGRVLTTISHFNCGHPCMTGACYRLHLQLGGTRPQADPAGSMR